MERLQYNDRYLFERLVRFREATGTPESVRTTVAEILAAVRERGDAALLEYTRRFDGYRGDAAGLRVRVAALRAAVNSLTAGQQAAIREAIESVRGYHAQCLPRSWMGHNLHGAEVGERWYPIRRVGIYIPAGSVPLVSTAVMTITLAKLAGVEEIAVATPGSGEGGISRAMLAGLALCGAEEVYQMGGAQAIAALAYGTQSIAKVCKVMGPGNVYVAEAQRQVFGAVGVDLLPGPSEALALVDAQARADWVAADLIAQAEHGSGKERIYLVTMAEGQADAIAAEVERQIGARRHAAAIRKVWEESSLCIEVPHVEAAVEVINQIAPEHLELHVERRVWESLVGRIRTAGAILCGHGTPTVLGDFVAGPSHTLPTGGTGHYFSGLKITDFMRRSSIVAYDNAALEKARAAVAVFAELEQLDGHGESMEIRFRAAAEGADGR